MLRVNPLKKATLGPHWANVAWLGERGPFKIRYLWSKNDIFQLDMSLRCFNKHRMHFYVGGDNWGQPLNGVLRGLIGGSVGVQPLYEIIGGSMWAWPR